MTYGLLKTMKATFFLLWLKRINMGRIKIINYMCEIKETREIK